MHDADQPKHRHSLTCGHGWRVVPVSLDLLSSILRDGCAATPVNVPGDMEVVGSMTKQNVFEAMGKPYPAGVVMLVCVSADWPKDEEIDRRTNDIRTFIPEYRRTA
jgi:hypothetical protein